MPERKLKIDVDGSGKISAVRSEPSKHGKWTFVYAPGAGSNVNDPFGAFASRELTVRGITVVRFQFPYMEAGKSSPDRPAVLEATWRAVMETVREPRRKLVVGGRSMGGRVASQAVARGAQADALALFAYPLHPPGNPAKMRTEHLPALRLPALFVSGTSDAFGAPDEIKAAAKLVKDSKSHFLEGADHGFAVKKASGRTKDDVFAEAVSVFSEWLLALK